MSKLTRNELLAVAGGLALGLGLFLTWYTTSDNPNARVGPCAEPSCAATGWEVHDLMRWLLLAAALAPFILAYIVARDRKLSWARGEMTAVVAVAAFGLVLYNGVIDRPGDPSGEIGIGLGWFLSLAGTIAMFLGSALRSSESERRRKPPGVM